MDSTIWGSYACGVVLEQISSATSSVVVACRVPPVSQVPLSNASTHKAPVSHIVSCRPLIAITSPSEAAARSQHYRLSKLVWRSFSCKGVQDLRSQEMTGLYCILGSALEGVPMLILQFCAYLALGRDEVFEHNMFATFKVSVAASLVSAAYNGGTSVQSVAENAITLKQKVSAGLLAGFYTLSATLVRCLTFANIIIHIREYFSRNRTIREQAKFHVSDTIPPLFIAGTIAVYWLLYWLLQLPKSCTKSLRDPHRLLTSMTFSYMSLMLGPLYPMASDAKDANQLGHCSFRLKLFMISFLHVLLDLVVLFITLLMGTLPRPYLFASLLGVAGYLLSLLMYMRFDESCGPRSSSNVYLPSEEDGCVQELAICMNADMQDISIDSANKDMKLLTCDEVAMANVVPGLSSSPSSPGSHNKIPARVPSMAVSPSLRREG